MTSCRARIVAAIHETTAFRLDRDSIRPENRAYALAIEMGRQSFLMQLGSILTSLSTSGLPFTCQIASVIESLAFTVFQLIPPRQPTAGIDGNPQPIIHRHPLQPPRRNRCPFPQARLFSAAMLSCGKVFSVLAFRYCPFVSADQHAKRYSR